MLRHPRIPDSICQNFNDDMFSFYIYLCCRSISQDIGSWIYNLPAGSLEYIRFCDCHNIDFGRFYFTDVIIGRSPKLWIKCLENSQVQGQKYSSVNMPLNMVMECALRVYLKRKHFISLKSYIIRLRVVTNQVNFIESDCT